MGKLGWLRPLLLGPLQLPKLDVAGSTPVARSQTSADLSRPSKARREEIFGADDPLAHGRGHVVTGVGSASPVMRTAPNVDPSSRILSDGCVPNTWP